MVFRWVEMRKEILSASFLDSTYNCFAFIPLFDSFTLSVWYG